jgi:hypothetical protein
MAYPTYPEISFDYTAYQQSLQGIESFPGTPMDNDLANLAGSLTETIDFIRMAFRGDGVLLSTSAPDSPTPPGVPVEVTGEISTGLALINLLASLEVIGIIIDNTVP